MIVLTAVAVGLLLGVILGGDLRRIGRAKVHGETVLLLLFFLQLALPVVRLAGVPARIGFAAWAVTLPACSFIAIRNRQLPGMASVGAGLALNAVVVLANSGMPVLPAAAIAAGGSHLSWIAGAGDFVHAAVVQGTRLMALADIIPIPWPLRGVASAGDVAMLSGIVAFVGGMPVVPAHRHEGVSDSAFTA